MKTDYYPPLEPERYYHIYNQGNDGLNIFCIPENYAYFLKKFDQYLSDFIELFCFCLMPNHFHALIKMKEGSTIIKNARKIRGFRRMEIDNFKIVNGNLSGDLVSEMIRRFFMAYTKAVNKQQHRSGSLFRKGFKRKKIDSVEYLRQMVYYIHHNPEHHGFTNDFRDYPWSSYQRILDPAKTKLKKDEVLGWFDDRDNYIFFHSIKPDLASLKDLPNLGW